MKVDRVQAVEFAAKVMQQLMIQLDAGTHVIKFEMRVETETAEGHRDSWTLIPQVFDVDAEFERLVERLEE